MAYGDLNYTTEEINNRLAKVKDTDTILKKESQNPIANGVVAAKFEELGNQLGEVSTLLDTLNGEVI